MQKTLESITIIRPTGFDLMFWLNYNCDGKVKVTPSDTANLIAAVHGIPVAERWQVSIYGLANSNVETVYMNSRQLLEFAISYGFNPAKCCNEIQVWNVK